MNDPRPTADKCRPLSKWCVHCGVFPGQPCEGAQLEIAGTESIERRQPPTRDQTVELDADLRQRGLFSS